MQEETQLLEIEKLKSLHPKHYFLVKKLLQAEKLNLELKNQITSTEEDRKEMRLEYSKITTALGLEDKLKKKIKDVEVDVKLKLIKVEGIRKNIENIKGKIKQTVDCIENSAVKDIIKKINEFKAVRAYYAEQIEKLNQENQDVQREIEFSSKNPKKISPAVANQNLRAEVKTLELQITQRSKEIKEKEREKLQTNFKYEETLKILSSLKAKVQEPPKPETKPLAKDQISIKPVNPLIIQKKIEEKRDSILGILEKGATKGTSKEVMMILKNVGKPGQGLASKVLELNRSQFPQSKSLISK